MAELVESGYLATSVTVNYDSRNLAIVKAALLNSWNYLLADDPKPHQPMGYKFTFKDPLGERFAPYAVVRGSETEIDHSVVGNEERIAEICDGVLSHDQLRPHEVVIVQETPLYVHPQDQKIDLGEILREAGPILTSIFGQTIDHPIRRRGLEFYFALGEQTFVLGFRAHSGPPALVECAIQGQYPNLKNGEALEQSLRNQAELFSQLATSMQDSQLLS